MLKNYLDGIHRFYAQAHGGSMNYPIMPAIVVSVTISSILAGIDMFLNKGQVLHYIISIHRLAIVGIMYLIVTIVYFHYSSRLPTKIELRKTDDKWLGVVICCISIIFAFLASISN